MKITKEMVESCFKDAIRTALEMKLFKSDILNRLEKETKIDVVPFRKIKHFGGRTSRNGRRIEICEEIPRRFRNWPLIYTQSVTDHEALGHAYFQLINPDYYICVFLPNKTSPLYDERYLKGPDYFHKEVLRQIKKLAYIERERRAYYVQYLITTFRIQNGLWSSLQEDSPPYRIIEEIKPKYNFQDLADHGVNIEDLERIVVYLKWE